MAFILSNGQNKYKFPILPQQFTVTPNTKTAIQKTIGGVVAQFLGFYITFKAKGLVNTVPMNKGGLEGEAAVLARFVEECHMAQKNGSTTNMTFEEKELIDVPVALGDFSVSQSLETVAFTYDLTMYENKMSELKNNDSYSEYFSGIISEIGFTDTGTGWHGGNGSTETALKYKEITGWPGLTTTASGSSNSNQTTPAHGSKIMTPSQAQAYAKSLLSKYGWGQGQFQYLVDVWNKESSWNMNAENPYTHAYGIPQCNPSWHPIGATQAFKDNAMEQIQWGLQYIKERYGSPEAAWESELTRGWY